MKTRGFTLTELLISISIIAVLITVALAAYSTVNKQSRDTKRKGDLEQIRSALEMYRTDSGFYPNINSGVWGDAAGLSTPLVSTYIAAVPADPKSTTQKYYYIELQPVAPNYYGYCVCTKLENPPSSPGTCTGAALDATQCNYGLKNP